MQYQFGPGPLNSEYEPTIQQIKSDIGIVEETDIATHAIPSGYYVIWKGDLYIAKTDISSGSTLSAASNGNLTAKTQGIGAEVAAQQSIINNGVFGDFHATYKLTGDVESIDDLFVDIPVNSANNNRTIGIDHSGNITGISGVNRQFILAWTNSTGKYAFAYIMTFRGLFYAWRNNSNAFNVTEVYSSLSYSRSSYTPTITAGTGFEVSNVSFQYNKFGKMLQVCGRFNITNLGTTNSMIFITLPSGMEAYSNGVGSSGGVYINNGNSYNGKPLSIRADADTSVKIQAGAGDPCTADLITGYVMVDFIVFLK